MDRAEPEPDSPRPALGIEKVALFGTDTIKDKKGKAYTIYKIQTTALDGRSWVTIKRFSDFGELREALLITQPGVADLDFPAKKFWGSMDEKTIAERQEVIGRWMIPVAEKYGSLKLVFDFLQNDGTGDLFTDTSHLELDADTLINDGKFKDHYAIGPELGRGAFSVVHRAVCKKTKVAFAVKLIDTKHPDYNEDEMKMEIKINHIVSGHEHIVNLVDVFRDAKHWYLIQEIVTGGELFNIVVRRAEKRADETHDEDARPYCEEEVSGMMRQIVTAIAFCHSKGVVHRDLKPENILAQTDDPKSLLKLADFGLASIIAKDKLLFSSSGTPEYVAPEVITRPPPGYDSKADIWSIGVLFYILLCGFPPFYGDTPRRTMEQVKTKEIEFPSPEWDLISDEAKVLIKTKLLNRDPTQRLTANELLAHPWITSNAHTRALPTVSRLKRFNAKRKLRAAYFALKATNRMKRLLDSMRATKQAATFTQTYTLEHVENLYDEFDEIVEAEAKNQHEDIYFINKPGFTQALNTVLELGGDTSLPNRHFQTFKRSDDAGVNYREYILALSTMFARSPAEKLKFAFEIFDTDASGSIDEEEFCELIFNFMALTQSHVDQAELHTLSRREFSTADTNGDGVVSIEEFITAAEKQPMLARYFKEVDRMTFNL